jgi:uncharacterized protein
MRVIARWLVVSLSLLCLPLAAQPVSGLYQVREVVASQQPEERDAALNRALETLVLRLTGDPQALQSPGLAALRNDPQQIISRYGYETSGQLRLLVEFDPLSSERTLRQAGLALWGSNRPAILAWWLNDSTEGSALVADAQPAAALLRNAAERSGLPLRLPLGDLDEQLLANAENLSAAQPEALLPASARYNADALLAVQAREADGQWQAQWQLWLGTKREQGSAQGADQQALADAVLQAVNMRLAPRFVSQPGASQALQVQVQGVNLKRYAQLQSLLAPFAARLQRAAGEQLVFSVNASPEQLRAQLALAQLQEGPTPVAETDAAPAPVAPGLLQFHW